MTTPQPASPLKKDLRRQARAIRDGLPMELIGAAIRENILAWEIFRRAENVLLYHAFRNEPNLIPLASREPDKRYFLPRVSPDGGMRFHLHEPGDKLTLNAFGIPEPAPDAPAWEASGGGLIFLPGLMFDREGYRLGYGKGFYDRFVSGMETQTVTLAGAVPEALLAPSLPRNEWDRRADWLVTETRILEAGS